MFACHNSGKRFDRFTLSKRFVPFWLLKLKCLLLIRCIMISVRKRITKRLEEASKELNFRLVNLSDITTHPSPNYLLVLQRSQQEAIADDAGLLIVESDVVVKKNTLQELYDGAAARSGCAIAAAVTVDENGVINYPYLHAKGNEGKIYPEKKHCSFCCSLLTPEFLRAFDFRQLDPTKKLV